MDETITIQDVLEVANKNGYNLLDKIKLEEEKIKKIIYQ